MVTRVVSAAEGPLVACFVGERYASQVPLDRVLAPPYDVIDAADREALAAREARNVVHVILPEGDGDRYARAAGLLDAWRRQGVLVRDGAAGVYVLRQRFAAPDGVLHDRVGIIGAVAAEPFSTGRVRPHERTHAGPKRDRLALLRATRTMCEVLLMLSRDSGGCLREELLRATGAEPAAGAELAGVELSLWAVQGAAGDRLAHVAAVEPLYIADGHHRYETACAYRGENARADRTLALIVPLGDPGLLVLPTHRLVPGRTVPESVVAGLRAHCTATRLPAEPDIRRALAEVRRGGGGCVVLLHGGNGYCLVRKTAPPAALAAAPQAVRSLDVAWADALVVPALQAAADGGTVSYSADLEETVAEVRRGAASAAVVLPPPTVANVLDVADADAVMPPKATFFSPKVPSGLVFLSYATGAV